MGDWWRNAGTDEETAAIDLLPGARAPLDINALAIRRLITSLESCHHKAARHVEVILEAIGRGSTGKVPGRRTTGALHPAERIWQTACAVLREWLEGDPSRLTDVDIGGVSTEELLRALGTKTPLAAWQVRRVIERVESFLHPDREYRNLECDLGPYGEQGQGLSAVRRWPQDDPMVERTSETIIHDTVNGQPARISLALAIDLLMPCHWNFPRNLRIVLRAIGGRPHSPEPLGVCGVRNIELLPIREDMRIVAAALGRFCGQAGDGGGEKPEVGEDVLALLGPPTPVKVWLAASLSKTLRLQLNL